MLKNKTILITGGTGSFGSAFVPLTIKKFKPKKLIIYSRDESKQWDMKILYSKNKNINFIIGDVRDYETLKENNGWSRLCCTCCCNQNCTNCRNKSF